MSEREKRDFNQGDRNNDHGVWKQAPHLHSTSASHQPSLAQQQPFKPLPVLAKPVASVLSIWTSRQRAKASNSHVEFAGRRYGEKAELYPSLNNSRCVHMHVTTLTKLGSTVEPFRRVLAIGTSRKYQEEPTGEAKGDLLLPLMLHSSHFSTRSCDFDNL